MEKEIVLGAAVIRDSNVIATEINLIKRQTAQQCLRATVEIGQLLCEAKSLVPHGSWGQWLEENVDYSQSTANNIMRIYNEFGTPAQMGFFEENRLEIFGSLSPSQAVALFALPKDERAAFVENHDMETMSVRDIQAEIKAMEAQKQVAEERAENLQAEVDRRCEEAKAAKKAAAEAQRQLREDQARFKAELAKLQAQAENAGQQTIAPPDVEKERAAIRAEMEKEFSDREKKATAALERELKTAKKESREQQARADKLEVQLKTAGAVAVQKFSVHFEMLQAEFETLKNVAADLKREDPDMATKLQAALRSILKTMQEVLV
ncbi:MAG: DUF3102 domain-containing protein [Clostridia bacterium]|nr:DUF3102 domain-containing protein [Clostridia bacterium]